MGTVSLECRQEGSSPRNGGVECMPTRSALTFIRQDEGEQQWVTSLCVLDFGCAACKAYRVSALPRLAPQQFIHHRRCDFQGSRRKVARNIPATDAGVDYRIGLGLTCGSAAAFEFEYLDQNGRTFKFSGPFLSFEMLFRPLLAPFWRFCGHFALSGFRTHQLFVTVQGNVQLLLDSSHFSALRR